MQFVDFCCMSRQLDVCTLVCSIGKEERKRSQRKSSANDRNRHKSSSSRRTVMYIHLCICAKVQAKVLSSIKGAHLRNAGQCRLVINFDDVPRPARRYSKQILRVAAHIKHIRILIRIAAARECVHNRLL